jgi:hypothetical protein
MRGQVKSHDFKVGDVVRWNSEAGHVNGNITKVHTSDTDYKGHTHRCSKDDPQYQIESDKTNHVAMHRVRRCTRLTDRDTQRSHHSLDGRPPHPHAEGNSRPAQRVQD